MNIITWSTCQHVPSKPAIGSIWIAPHKTIVTQAFPCYLTLEVSTIPLHIMNIHGLWCVCLCARVFFFGGGLDLTSIHVHTLQHLKHIFWTCKCCFLGDSQGEGFWDDGLELTNLQNHNAISSTKMEVEWKGLKRYIRVKTQFLYRLSELGLN